MITIQKFFWNPERWIQRGENFQLASQAAVETEGRTDFLVMAPPPQVHGQVYGPLPSQVPQKPQVSSIQKFSHRTGLICICCFLFPLRFPNSGRKSQFCFMEKEQPGPKSLPPFLVLYNSSLRFTPWDPPFLSQLKKKERKEIALRSFEFWVAASIGFAQRH